MTAAALRAVWKRFGPIAALRGVNLEVHAGEVVALLGPNGAGKTSALSVLLGLRRPDSGRAELFGRDPRQTAARSAIGATPQESGFPQTLRVREIVDLVRAHYPDPAHPAELLDRFGLVELARRQAGGLSAGERRRLSVALAFAGRPRAVFLDEPTASLDVESRRGLWNAIRDYASAGGTVLLTTHHLEEAEALASRIVVLARGEIVAEGSAAALRRRAGVPLAAGLEEAFLALTEGAP